MAIRKSEVEKAINGSFGILVIAAKRLGCSRGHLYRLINQYDLHDLVKEERESLKDFTESQLVKNIKSGKEASIFFYLKTQAKDRGYIERQEIAGTDGGPIIINVTDTD